VVFFISLDVQTAEVERFLTETEEYINKLTKKLVQYKAEEQAGEAVQEAIAEVSLEPPCAVHDVWCPQQPACPRLLEPLTLIRPHLVLPYLLVTVCGQVQPLWAVYCRIAVGIL
jgi:hypothetical protein